MPNSSDRPFGHDTLKLRAVFVPEDAKGQTSKADITNALGYDAVKFPAIFVRDGEARPGHPYVSIGRAEFRPSKADAPRKVYGSWQKPPPPEDDAQEAAAPGPRMPRTRNRFGAALSDKRADALPPKPGLGREAPVTAGVAAWRGMATPGKTLRRVLAAPGPARSPAVAAASGTQNPPATSNGGAAARDAPDGLQQPQPDHDVPK